MVDFSPLPGNVACPFVASIDGDAAASELPAIPGAGRQFYYRGMHARVAAMRVSNERQWHYITKL